jgi:hypothetical protein
MSNETVAIITDIHGNRPALQATLARIDKLRIERIYCGGDLVGYGPHPNEVVALIAERGIPTIYGNYDPPSPATTTTAVARTSPRTTASSGSNPSSGRSSPPTRRRRTGCESSRSTSTSRSGMFPCTSCTALRARSTSTCSRTSRPARQQAVIRRGCAAVDKSYADQALPETRLNPRGRAVVPHLLSEPPGHVAGPIAARSLLLHVHFH